MTKIPELILPAADLKRTKYAFMYGADAVYGGLPHYSLRKAEVNFTHKTLGEAIDYAHSLKKKFYVTLNIFPKNFQIEILKKEIKKLAILNPDAFIISDPGFIHVAKKLVPKIRIHLSTQANTLNYESVKFWKSQGVKRIVLARELSLKEIREINDKVKGVELECFVHGAMCISYSGRCLMSAFMTGRESNQGLCTQPCRWQYWLAPSPQPLDARDYVRVDPRRNPRKSALLEEDDKGTYIMNSKDLCLIEHLDELADAGVSAFKIEGRNKSEYYVAIVARAYRQAVDALAASRQPLAARNKNKKTLRASGKGLVAELQTLNYRDYTTGFLYGKAKFMGETYNDRAPIKKYEFVGVVLTKSKIKDPWPGRQRSKTQIKNEKIDSGPSFVKSFGTSRRARETQEEYSNNKTERLAASGWGLTKIQVRNKIKKGDELELITPTETIKFKIKDFYNLRKEKITEAHPGNKNSYIFAELPKVPINTLIRKKF